MSLMALKITCPMCRSSYQLADRVAGTEGRAKTCRPVFRAAAAAAPAAEPPRIIESAIQKERPAAPPLAPRRAPRGEGEREPAREHTRNMDEEQPANSAVPWII